MTLSSSSAFSELLCPCQVSCYSGGAYILRLCFTYTFELQGDRERGFLKNKGFRLLIIFVLCSHVCRCVCVCEHIWKPEDDIGCHSSSDATLLVFWGRVFHWQPPQRNQRDQPVSTSSVLELQECARLAFVHLLDAGITSAPLGPACYMAAVD